MRTATEQWAPLALPGRRLDLPWPPQAPNINFLHSLILLARMQGVLPLTQRVFGDRICWGPWGACQTANTKPHPDPLADHSEHPRSLLIPGLPSRHSQISPLCALHAELGEGTLLPSGGRSCGRLPLGPYKTAGCSDPIELATPLGSTSLLSPDLKCWCYPSAESPLKVSECLCCGL